MIARLAWLAIYLGLFLAATALAWLAACWAADAVEWLTRRRG